MCVHVINETLYNYFSSGIDYERGFPFRGKKKTTKHLNCNLLSGSGLLSITFHRDLLSSYRRYCNCRDYKK